MSKEMKNKTFGINEEVTNTISGGVTPICSDHGGENRQNVAVVPEDRSDKKKKQFEGAGIYQGSIIGA